MWCCPWTPGLGRIRGLLLLVEELKSRAVASCPLEVAPIPAVLGSVGVPLSSLGTCRFGLAVLLAAVVVSSLSVATSSSSCSSAVVPDLIPCLGWVCFCSLEWLHKDPFQHRVLSGGFALPSSQRTLLCRSPCCCLGCWCSAQTPTLVRTDQTYHWRTVDHIVRDYLVWATISCEMILKFEDDSACFRIW